MELLPGNNVTQHDPVLCIQTNKLPHTKIIILSCMQDLNVVMHHFISK